MERFRRAGGAPDMRKSTPAGVPRITPEEVLGHSHGALLGHSRGVLHLFTLKLDLKHRLKRFEDSLVETESVAEARELLSRETNTLRLLPNSKAVRKAIKHIQYLSEYWTTDNLWQSWANYGRTVAAALLRCHIDGVIPTTNHLESFNGVLKRKHLRRWQNGGRRLRVDVLIRILIIHILPSIFKERKLYREQSLRLAAQIRQLPGGQSLLQTQTKLTVPGVAYLVADDARHQRAVDLINLRQIGMPSYLPERRGVFFSCYSSEALEVELEPLRYRITILFTGVATCECTDFRKNGGACKHIRAALILLDHLRGQGLEIPLISIPQSITQAHALEIQSSPLPPSAATKPSETSRPTLRAAAAVTDILASDESCHDPFNPEEEDGNDESDNESVATDASSNSSDSDDEPEDEPEPQSSQTVPKNQQALGEQALARTLFELDDMGQKFGDLAEFLKHHPGSLSDSSRDLLTKRAEPVAAFMAEIRRLCRHESTPSLPSLFPSAPSLPSSIAPSQPRSTQTSKRKAHLLPPSPEKASKRHQSFAPR
ncbi:hypothetical protein C8F04DRAFT_1047632 [Mycena alexandri]|uniref:SWIM-type domain-containing protein n=1 Tax=Mycena alexandri TaxID=1745969 RepID=A0AAD6SA54_9AGAR|nr:hypothetical protein C8F04DRAFT_1047632 [Mycena alexandri]